MKRETKQVVRVEDPFPEVVLDFVGEGFGVHVAFDRTGDDRMVRVRVQATTPDRYSSEFTYEVFEVCLPEYTDEEDE